MSPQRTVLSRLSQTPVPSVWLMAAVYFCELRLLLGRGTCGNELFHTFESYLLKFFVKKYVDILLTDFSPGNIYKIKYLMMLLVFAI